MASSKDLECTLLWNLDPSKGANMYLVNIPAQKNDLQYHSTLKTLPDLGYSRTIPL